MMMGFDVRRVGRKVRLTLGVAMAALTLMQACGGNAANEDAQTAPAEVQQDLMTRWNAVAETVDVGDFGTFKWEGFDQFPHPTFKGGSEQAYQLFAETLVAFYERADNFEYMTTHKCFSITLRYVFSSGQTGFQTSFAALTDDFSRNDWIPGETRDKLIAFANRIRTAH
jgi:hypothetical protein